MAKIDSVVFTEKSEARGSFPAVQALGQAELSTGPSARRRAFSRFPIRLNPL
jgi:hypothetical protein